MIFAAEHVHALKLPVLEPDDRVDYYDTFCTVSGQRINPDGKFRNNLAALPNVEFVDILVYLLNINASGHQFVQGSISSCYFCLLTLQIFTQKCQK